MTLADDLRFKRGSRPFLVAVVNWYNLTTKTEETFYFSERPYATEAGGTPASQEFLPYLRRGSEGYSASIHADVRTAGGHAEIDFGSYELINLPLPSAEELIDDGGELVGTHLGGVAQITFDNFQAAGRINRGDVIKVNETSYFAAESKRASGGTVSLLKIVPALAQAELDNATVTVTRPKPGGARRLDFLREYECEGRQIDVYALGTVPTPVLGATGSQGSQALTWATKAIVATNSQVGTDWGPPDGDIIRLPLEPRGYDLAKTMGVRYLGLGQALGFDGSSTRAVVSDPWDPEDEATDSFVIQGRIQLPAPHASAVGGRYIIDKTNWWVRVDNADNLAVLTFGITTSSGSYTVSTDALASFHEQWYWFTAVYDEDEDEIQIYVNKEAADNAATATAGTLTASTDDLYIGRKGTGGGFFLGILCELRIFTGALTPSTFRSYLDGPILSTTDGLIANWRGDVDSPTTPTKLYDYGPSRDPRASPPSIFDATISIGSGAACHSCEGGEELAGNQKPEVIGYVRHAKGVLVDPTRWIYQFNNGRSMDALAVYVKGSAKTHVGDNTSLIDLFADGTPAGGSYRWYPHQSLVRLDSVDGEVTADLWGRTPYGAGLHFDRSAATDKVDFGTTPNSTFYGSDFTLEFKVFFSDDTDIQYLFNSEDGLGAGVYVLYRNTTGLANIISFSTPIGTAQVAIDAETPTMVSWVRENTSGSNYDMRIYFDGVEVYDGSFSGSDVGPSATAFVAGVKGSSGWFGGVLNELRIWSDVRTLEEIQDNLYLTGTDIVGQSGLAHYYPVEPDVGSTWTDYGSATTANGTITGAEWEGGVAIASHDNAAYSLLTEPSEPSSLLSIRTSSARVRTPSVNVGTFSGGSRAPIGARFYDKISLLGAISEIIASCGGWLIYDRVNGLWSLKCLYDWREADSVQTIEEWDIVELDARGAVKPRSEFECGWGQTGGIVTELTGSAEADAEVRALLSKELRFATGYADNAEAYLLTDPLYEAGGRWKNQTDAKAWADTFAEIYGRRLYGYSLDLFRGLLEFNPGDVVTINHRRMVPSGSAKVLVVRVEDRVNSATIEVLR